MSTRAVLSVRLPKDLHAMIHAAAGLKRASVNRWIEHTLRAGVKRQARRDPALGAIIGRLE